MTDINPEYGLF